ncbi:MAG: hypothetical protein JWP57_4740 [Spirosoma sp.]|nr:hypothetical protein [Spirosoma sp.]
MYKIQLHTLILCCLMLLSAVSISRASASETLFFIVKKTDWLTYANSLAFSPPSLKKDGFLSLVTPEQVVPMAQKLFQGQDDLLLLKLHISAVDPHLKWETVPGSEHSFPHYYGDLPRQFVRKIYPFQPQQDGKYVFPADPLLKRITTRLVPKGLVNTFLSYQDWQQTRRFHRLQVNNFLRPKVQLQWWYFDFFFEDGSSAVLAFIPQLWWDETEITTEKKARFTLSLKTKQGLVKRFSTVVPQAEIITTADHLEIPSHLVIRSIGSGDQRQYTIQVSFPEIDGVFKIGPTQPPFAPFPGGVMPGILQTVLSGAPWGAPSFSYVSQIPNSRVSGSLAWGNYQALLDGQAYHEQGRLDDTPERQGSNWAWYHFAGAGWNIFGTPGSYIYLQHGDRIVRSGFHLISANYTLQNRTYDSPDHARIMTGGEINFQHEDLSFRLTLRPSSAKTLVCFPSPNPNQVWGTVEGNALLTISEGTTTKTFEGRMFLETCSWEVGLVKKQPTMQRSQSVPVFK